MTKNTVSTDSTEFTFGDFTFANSDDMAAAYSAADIGGKAKLRNSASAAIKQALRDRSFEFAANLSDAVDVAFVAASPTKSTVDYYGMMARRYVVLTHAVEMAATGNYGNLPDGFEFDEATFNAAVETVIENSDRSDTLSECTDYLNLRVRAEKGDVGAFIQSAVQQAAQPVKVSVLRMHRTTMYRNGEAAPSAGAIAAALNAIQDGTRTINGVKVVSIEGRLGAGPA